MSTNNSAIKRVTFYEASPAECCDRCSAGIKYVSLVSYADGTKEQALRQSEIDARSLLAPSAPVSS